MSMKRLFGGTAIEAQMHSLHSDCKNVQKSALKSVNVQRTGKSILQMFAFSFIDGRHICRFLPNLRPPTVPRSHFKCPRTKAFALIISYLYLQTVTSASEIRFCVGKWTFWVGKRTFCDSQWTHCKELRTMWVPQTADRCQKSSVNCGQQS